MPGGAVSGSPGAGLGATWSGEHDVVLTLAAGTVARGAHVRAYPRRFQRIASIGPEPSFERGDGGAAIVADETQPLSILLDNPLGLEPGADRPADAVLVVDLV